MRLSKWAGSPAAWVKAEEAMPADTETSFSRLRPKSWLDGSSSTEISSLSVYAYRPCNSVSIVSAVLVISSENRASNGLSKRVLVNREKVRPSTRMIVQTPGSTTKEWNHSRERWSDSNSSPCTVENLY